MKGGIFISYRREDAAGYAGRLYDRLAAHFGDDHVFMDVEGIEAGADFVDAIERAVGACEILIVIIGNDWLAKDKDGKRRLDDPSDFVRLETAAALKRGIRVVPVLVEGAAIPRADELPADLAKLARRQAVELNHRQWDATSGQLIATLERILSSDRAESAGDAGTPFSARATRPHATRRYVALAAIVLIGAAIAALAWLNPWSDKTETVHGASVLYVTPGAVQFAERPLRAGGDPSEVRLENVGPGSVRIKGLGIEGANASDFALTDDRCSGRELDAGKTCTVKVTFSAQAEGTRSATLAIAHDGRSVPPSVALQGRGAGPVVVTVGPPPAPPKTVEKPADRATETKSDKTADKAVKPPEKVAEKRSKPEQVAAAKPPLGGRKPSPDADTASKTSPAQGVAVPDGIGKSPDSPATAASMPAKLPRVGDLWQYQSKSIWRTVEPRSYTHRVTAVSEREIQETMTVAGGASAAESKTFGGDTRYVEWRGTGYYIVEFNPFLAAFDALAPDTTWKALKTPTAEPTGPEWYTQGRATGWESVTVPAGTFKALRVQIDSSRQMTASLAIRGPEAARIVYVAWYAPEAKRTVKHVRTVYGATANKLDEDTYELVRYTLQ